MSSEGHGMMPPVKILVIGGCRSGKSRFAEQWAEERFRNRTYLATLEDTGDLEMKRRIAQHRERRGQGWRNLEEPCDLVGVMEKEGRATEVFLIDCLTLWLTNLIQRGDTDGEIENQVRGLCRLLRDIEISVVLVANEVGLGLVPESALGRRFRDLSGWTNQQVGAVCDQVVMVAAGLPLRLKG